MKQKSQSKKILITGGAGFIGSNFVHHLMEETDYSIIVFDKLTYAGNISNIERWMRNKRFQFIKGDIADQKTLAIIFELQNFDGVVHFAAESHVDRSISNPENFIKTNTLGTFYLLELFRKSYKDFDNRRFLHISTDEVYGSLGPVGSFTETTPYSPNSPYSASKASADHLVRAYHHTYNLPTLTTNCSNNYGPYHFPEKLIPLVIVNCLLGKPIPVYGTGSNVRDWLYVKDHCSAVLQVLENGKIGHSYNIGSRNERTNLELIEKICSIMDLKFPNNSPHSNLIAHVTDRPGHDFRYSIDPSKIEKELNWKPKFTFEDSLYETVDWYIRNQDWWKKILTGEYMNYYQKQYGLN